MYIRAICKNCKDIVIVEQHREFKSCSCFSNTEDNKGFAIDAGDEYYCRIIARENIEDIEINDNINGKELSKTL